MSTATQISIVIAGNWNPRIFTPNWVAQNLFGMAQGSALEFGVNLDDLDLMYEHEDIELYPKYSFLEITTKKCSVENCSKISNMALKILSLLPQTPVKAVGVNFRYELSRSENSSFLKKIEVKNEFDGFELNQTKHSKKKSDKCVLNINSDIRPDKVKVNFNFHYQGGILADSIDPKFAEEHLEEVKLILGIKDGK